MQQVNVYRNAVHLPYVKEARLLIFAQQKIRNMRKNYTTEEIIMFERNAGLIKRLKDTTIALEDCNPNEDLLRALQPLHLRILSLLAEAPSNEMENVSTPAGFVSRLSLTRSTQQSRADAPPNQTDSPDSDTPAGILSRHSLDLSPPEPRDITTNQSESACR